MLCSASFWQILQRRQRQAVFEANFPLDNIGGMENGNLLHGQPPISRKTFAQDCTMVLTLQRRLTATVKYGKQQSTDGRSPKVLSVRGTGKREHRDLLRFKDVFKRDERTMNTERWGRRRLRTLTLFTPWASVRREKTDSGRRGEAYSKERKKKHGNIEGECLHIYYLQSWLALPYGPVHKRCRAIISSEASPT